MALFRMPMRTPPAAAMPGQLKPGQAVRAMPRRTPARVAMPGGLRRRPRLSPPAAIGSMVLIFDTSLEAGGQITLPLQGTVNCHVDWGDSSSEDYTTAGDKTHTYSSGGTYTVTITGTLTQFGKSFGGTYANAAKLTECRSFGAIGLERLDGAFVNAANLTVAPSTLPASVFNLRQVFDGCTSFDQDISGWDVSSVTGMFQMLKGATAFNQDLGAWNTAACTTMSGIFHGATSYTGAGLDSWNLSGLNASAALDDFATGCTFSTASYDALLIAWEAGKASYRSDLSPNFGSSAYTGGGAAATARGDLVTYGWTITDGGTA